MKELQKIIDGAPDGVDYENFSKHFEYKNPKDLSLADLLGKSPKYKKARGEFEEMESRIIELQEEVSKLKVERAHLLIKLGDTVEDK